MPSLCVVGPLIKNNRHTSASGERGWGRGGGCAIAADRVGEQPPQLTPPPPSCAKSKHLGTYGRGAVRDSDRLWLGALARQLDITPLSLTPCANL